eukprot:Skav225404  [mRNA]  locus=scaffold2656:496119:501684:+ [translate_table: standard]
MRRRPMCIGALDGSERSDAGSRLDLLAPIEEKKVGKRLTLALSRAVTQMSCTRCLRCSYSLVDCDRDKVIKEVIFGEYLSSDGLTVEAEAWFQEVQYERFAESTPSSSVKIAAAPGACAAPLCWRNGKKVGLQLSGDLRRVVQAHVNKAARDYQKEEDRLAQAQRQEQLEKKKAKAKAKADVTKAKQALRKKEREEESRAKRATQEWDLVLERRAENRREWAKTKKVNKNQRYQEGKKAGSGLSLELPRTILAARRQLRAPRKGTARDHLGSQCLR